MAAGTLQAQAGAHIGTHDWPLNIQAANAKSALHPVNAHSVKCCMWQMHLARV